MPPVVALLGGSFNPAHDGHIHISRAAKHLLNIDHIWWMVSPQNPLKPTADMEDFHTRLSYARQFAAKEHYIHVTDVEFKLGSNHTAKTLTALKRRYPHTRFIWLMGADNLATIHHWERWTNIFSLCPILVLDRAPLSHRALHAKAAIRFKKHKVNMEHTRLLTLEKAPIWCFAHIKKHPASSSFLRKTLGKKSFLL